MRLDYKDHWQEYYNHAIEELKLDEIAAGKYADEQLAAIQDDPIGTWCENQ